LDKICLEICIKFESKLIKNMQQYLFLENNKKNRMDFYFRPFRPSRAAAHGPAAFTARHRPASFSPAARLLFSAQLNKARPNPTVAQLAQ
jgi:hypothetical protein